MVNPTPQALVRLLPPGIPHLSPEQPQMSQKGNLACGICTRGDSANAKKNYA